MGASGIQRINSEMLITNENPIMKQMAAGHHVVPN